MTVGNTVMPCVSAAVQRAAAASCTAAATQKNQWPIWFACPSVTTNIIARHLLCSSACVPGMDAATASKTGRIRAIKGKRFEMQEVPEAVPTYATDAATHAAAPTTWYAMYWGVLHNTVACMRRATDSRMKSQRCESNFFCSVAGVFE